VNDNNGGTFTKVAKAEKKADMTPDGFFEDLLMEFAQAFKQNKQITVD
jgi:hypothetical protein